MSDKAFSFVRANVSISVPQVVESLGDTGRDVSLIALLAYIGWDIPDDD